MPKFLRSVLGGEPRTEMRATGQMQKLCDNHPDLATDCFYYKLEQEDITIKTREKQSYNNEAKKLATEKMIKPNQTYAAVVLSNNNEYSNRKATSANLNVVTQIFYPPVQPQSINIRAQAHPNNYRETPTTDINLATSSRPAVRSSGAIKSPTNKYSYSNKRPTNNKTLTQLDNAAAGTKKTQAIETTV